MTASVKVEFVNPFISAAHDVLEAELGAETTRGNLRLNRSACTSDEVTALVGVSGALRGVVMYSMSQDTARAIAGQMLGQDFEVLDALVESGIGELGNVITGRASVWLAEAGYPSSITPPALVLGRGIRVAPLDLNRLVLPIETPFGAIEVELALSSNRPGG